MSMPATAPRIMIPGERAMTMLRHDRAFGNGHQASIQYHSLYFFTVQFGEDAFKSGTGQASMAQTCTMHKALQLHQVMFGPL